MNTFINNEEFNKNKVIFIMAATSTDISCLSIDLATYFREEIINFDKMQVYKGLKIITKKITHSEKQGVRPYMLRLWMRCDRFSFQMQITPNESDGPSASLKWTYI
ncbi:hypothetical protein EJD97_003981 [Solanum chilense]|uniref:Uncharacterized protein n=1 Tax=Solanum chilense TaxID=4083 RepID=A0A6N2BV46_SOLCI|nr:hypothetical protein EJD97_003981 [Solanum chilense]